MLSFYNTEERDAAIVPFCYFRKIILLYGVSVEDESRSLTA